MPIRLISGIAAGAIKPIKLRLHSLVGNNISGLQLKKYMNMPKRYRPNPAFCFLL